MGEYREACSGWVNGADNLQPAAGFHDRDDLLAFHLASGSTREDAARATGCSERTVYTRLSDPVFKSRVTAFRQAMIDQAVGKLATVAGRAVEVLSKALDDERATIRVRAATTLIDALLRMRTHAEFDERLSELERQAARSGDRP